jgi:CRP-like cAMP-binding protein
MSRLGQAMKTSVLTLPERANLEGARWFSSLSAGLRSDILDRATVRRLPDGSVLSNRGEAAGEWCGVALGAVRIGTVSLSGKQVALTYVEPGSWFGDIALFDGLPRTHDATTHGPTTILTVRKADFHDLLERHVELYDALLRLNCRRLRLMFDLVEDLNTRPLAARLARQLLLLARRYGVVEDGVTRIGLQLAQEDLAQLLGASRQRVNQELKALERQGALRVEPSGVAVLAPDLLEAAAER